jgi:F-type H+-transporting ATPase subunit f
LVSKYPQAHPELFARMKYFYKVLPKGNAMKETPNGIVARYKAKYFENNSLMPVLHFFGVMVPVGYYIAYFKGGHYHPLKEFH